MSLKSINEPMERAIQIAGSQMKLGLAIGYPQSSIWKVLHNKRMLPERFVPRIVKFTEGKVKAHELRPDMPELFPPPS